MVLVIDTSSPRSALALVGQEGALAEDIALGGREHDLRARAQALTEPGRLTAVAVGLGPGSFTGLRVGVSFGVGLALGLGVPLLGLGSLELQGARAPCPAVAMVDAGRGRLYWLPPGGEPQMGQPADLPPKLPAVGWLRPATAEAVRAAGVTLLPEQQLLSFAEAAALLLRAGEPETLGYDTVKLKYMQSFGTLRE